MVDPKANMGITLPVPLSRCTFHYLVAVLVTIMLTLGLALKIQVTRSSFVIHRIMFISNKGKVFPLQARCGLEGG